MISPGRPAHPSQVIVFMSDTPRNSANKVQRIRFAERVGMRELSDALPPVRGWRGGWGAAGCARLSVTPSQSQHECLRLVACCHL